MYRFRYPRSEHEFKSIVYCQVRFIKTLRTRTTVWLGVPLEFQIYQRYTTNPSRTGGPQFNSHYKTHQRWRDWKNSAVVDHLSWGKELGTAWNAQRHQRVAFGHHEPLHPTNIPRYLKHNGLFEGQDPSMEPGGVAQLARGMSPDHRPYNAPDMWNTFFGTRRGLEGNIRFIKGWESYNKLWTENLGSYSDTGSEMDFGVQLDVDTLQRREAGYDGINATERAHPIGKVPGLHIPYKGEPDTKMMQAMAMPIRFHGASNNSVCTNEGRFSTSIYINVPHKDNCLSELQCKMLEKAVDQYTNGFRSKLVVVTAAQSGLTDSFCSGLDYQRLAFYMSMWHRATKEVAQLKKRVKELPDSEARLRKETDILLQRERETANEYFHLANSTLCAAMSLIWRCFTAPRPLMTLINGKCSNIGCGLALFAKYSSLRDSTEFIHEGPRLGITPIGGLTHLLARPETSLKYPGLGEYIMLTATPLYAGDALRLGWSDLFSTLPNMDFSIKEWFDTTEHMHNDAVAWQLGFLLESCFMMKQHHTLALERGMLSVTRAKWIEDVFADQPSVDAILSTLSEVEKLPLHDANNAHEENRGPAFTLGTLEQGLEKLRERNLSFILAPFDITPAGEEEREEEEVVANVFLRYYFERDGKQYVAKHKDTEKLQRWRAHRQQEYQDFKAMKEAPITRRVFARLEGCEKTVVQFDFCFHKSDAEKKLHAEDEDLKQIALLTMLKQKMLEKLGMPLDRRVTVGWYLPTLETCPLRRDEEVLEALHHDPGIESMQEASSYPPIYFVVRRDTMYLSEWAFAVKHQILLSSPLALKASFQLFQEVRGDGSPGTIKSISETLQLEFRYFSHMLRQHDFFVIGAQSSKSMEDWEKERKEQGNNIHECDGPVRPIYQFDDIFDRNVKMEGHHFILRPKWSPSRLQDVTPDLLASVSTELNFAVDGITEIDVPSYTHQRRHVYNSANEVGIELVAGLGDKDKNGQSKVPPLQSDVQVPQNVNFYTMARHPWNEQEHSWRQHGFTKGSEEYFHKKYQEAEKAVYDREGKGVHNYWPNKDDVDDVTASKEEALLQDRFWGAVKKAEGAVDSWVSKIREAGKEGKFNYSYEVPTPQEKTYDDQYYRWFIQPGHHPNPSGILKYGFSAGPTVEATTKPAKDTEEQSMSEGIEGEEQAKDEMKEE